MSIEQDKKQFTLSGSPEVQSSSPVPSQQSIQQYIQAQDADVKSFFPSEMGTSLKLEERQETTRSQLAMFLIKILAGTIIASFGLIILLIISSVFIRENQIESFDKTSNLVKDLITFILTAQTGLIGTALGFYFGSRVRSKD